MTEILYLNYKFWWWNQVWSTAIVIKMKEKINETWRNRLYIMMFLSFWSYIESNKKNKIVFKTIKRIFHIRMVFIRFCELCFIHFQWNLFDCFLYNTDMLGKIIFAFFFLSHIIWSKWNLKVSSCFQNDVFWIFT